DLHVFTSFLLDLLDSRLPTPLPCDILPDSRSRGQRAIGCRQSDHSRAGGTRSFGISQKFSKISQRRLCRWNQTGSTNLAHFGSIPRNVSSGRMGRLSRLPRRSSIRCLLWSAAPATLSRKSN